MLMVLGLFVFERRTLPHQSMQYSKEYRFCILRRYFPHLLKGIERVFQHITLCFMLVENVQLFDGVQIFDGDIICPDIHAGTGADNCIVDGRGDLVLVECHRQRITAFRNLDRLPRFKGFFSG